MRTHRKPIVELRLTRKQAEVNLLSTLALTEAETASEKADAADTSNVELASNCTGSGRGGRDHLHMQLNTGTKLTKVELTTTYRHGYNIHRRMGRQRVQSRPIFVSRKMADVRDGISTTSRRQLSTKYRPEIFAHTGVPAQEYDISLPCGMRREALPIRNELMQLATGQHDVNDREQRLVTLQIQHDREECRRQQHHVKEQKADRKQNSAKAKKKRERAAGYVRVWRKVRRLHTTKKIGSVCVGTRKRSRMSTGGNAGTQQDEQEGTGNTSWERAEQRQQQR
jgi:hypothetical protein